MKADKDVTDLDIETKEDEEMERLEDRIILGMRVGVQMFLYLFILGFFKAYFL